MDWHLGLDKKGKLRKLAWHTSIHLSLEPVCGCSMASCLCPYCHSQSLSHCRTFSTIMDFTLNCGSKQGSGLLFFLQAFYIVPVCLCSAKLFKVSLVPNFLGWDLTSTSVHDFRTSFLSFSNLFFSVSSSSTVYLAGLCIAAA